MLFSISRNISKSFQRHIDIANKLKYVQARSPRVTVFNFGSKKKRVVELNSSKVNLNSEVE